jgi:hypothetical protein
MNNCTLCDQLVLGLLKKGTQLELDYNPKLLV